MGAPAKTTKLAPFTLLDEPRLAFSPTEDHTHVHPLRGLLDFGPFSQGSFSGYTPSLRIATVGPNSTFKQRGELMKLLIAPQAPTDRAEYVPAYPGFEAVFRAGLKSAPAEAHIRWPDRLEQLPGDGPATARLLQAMDSALQRLNLVRDQFDVVLVHFPESWSLATRAPLFDAHDALKALGAKHGEEVVLTAEGDGADEALDSLVDLLSQDLDA